VTDLTSSEENSDAKTSNRENLITDCWKH